jgi:uncharacterized protein YjbI with pentapeptide repeats
MADDQAPGNRLLEVFTCHEKQQLEGMDVRGLEMNYVDFAGANLRWARFEDVSLYGCDFSRADLREAKFIRCDLRTANFLGATFGRTSFDDSLVIGARGLSTRMSEYVRSKGGLSWLC